MNQYEQNLETYIKNQHTIVQVNKFTDYDLSKSLGYIYFLDKYHHIEDISQSYIHKYLPILFETDTFFHVYELYSLFHDSDINHKIFENLYQIKKVLNKISRRS